MKTDTPALIHAYTRAEAIADGVLIPVHPEVSAAARLEYRQAALRARMKLGPAVKDRIHFGHDMEEETGGVETLQLWMLIGLGDAGEMVGTVMLEGED